MEIQMARKKKVRVRSRDDATLENRRSSRSLTARTLPLQQQVSRIIYSVNGDSMYGKIYGKTQPTVTDLKELTVEFHRTGSNREKCQDCSIVSVINPEGTGPPDVQARGVPVEVLKTAISVRIGREICGPKQLLSDQGRGRDNGVSKLTEISRNLSEIRTSDYKYDDRE